MQELAISRRMILLHLIVSRRNELVLDAILTLHVFVRKTHIINVCVNINANIHIPLFNTPTIK